ncbi:MAG: N-acetylmuramoyl-L-alanine amidase [bacterium]
MKRSRNSQRDLEVNPTFIIQFVVALLVAFSSFSAYPQNSDWQRNLHFKARKIGRDFYFVGLQTIAEALNTNTYYSNKVRKAVLHIGDKNVTVTAFNPFVLVGTRVLQMPVQATYRDGEIYVPVKFFLPILESVLAESTNSDGADDLSTSANITGVQIEEKLNGTLIRVKTLRGFDKSSVSTRFSRGWLYLDILHGKIDEASFRKDFKKGLIREIEPVQSDQMTQLSFKISRDITGQNLAVDVLENEILVSVPKEKVSTDLLNRLQSDREKWLIDKIVIDPGHGGKDPGTIGVSGAYEKDVVLRIAKKLRKLLEKKLDAQVYMTRETDTYISLKERTQFANKKEAKLFISIHANWNRSSKLRGASTYFLGLAKSDEAIEIAQRENEVIKYDDDVREYSELTDENIILATMAQNAYNKESEDLARMIQTSIAKHTGIRDRGIKQAGFYVMVGASMPNVLIETAFMSNKREEKMLRSGSFQQKVAQAIYESIKKFKEKYDLTIRAGKG